MARRDRSERVRTLEISLDEVSLRCMGCQAASSLAAAARSGWRMCANCNFFICALCGEQARDGEPCFSPVAQLRGQPFRLVPIPVERLLVFARSGYRRIYRRGLLYRLFFEPVEARNAPYTLVEPEPPEAGLPREIGPRIQEETWSNHQLVLTKRRGGKFITWERIV
jgi:hypothetical protein